MLLVYKDYVMMTVSVKEESAKLSELIEDVAASHKPVVITSKHHNAVLVAEDHWKAITETLHRLSAPGMQKSILGGVQEGIEGAAKELKWLRGY